MDYTKLHYSVKISGEEIAEYDRHLTYEEMMKRCDYLRCGGLKPECDYYVIKED